MICRGYVKGRDWYDFIWYIAQRVRPNYELLTAALEQTGHRAGTAVIDREQCVALLEEKIMGIDWAKTRVDMERFVKPHERSSLDLWGAGLFLAQCKKMES